MAYGIAESESESEAQASAGTVAESWIHVEASGVADQEARGRSAPGP